MKQKPENAANVRGWKMWAILPHGDGGTNGCVYATEREARAAGDELFTRWMAMVGSDAFAVDEEPNYRFDFEANRNVRL